MRRKKRKGYGKSKGSSFERKICTILSLWWTDNERDDVFWRSAGSGARATVRRGIRTEGHAGDVCYTDPIGKPLIDLVTIELKRGYKDAVFSQAIDRPENSKASQWETFVRQAEQSARDAGSVSWFLIQQRDRRRALLFMSCEFWEHIRAAYHSWTPFVQMAVRINKRRKWIVCVALEDFLDQISRRDLKAVLKFTRKAQDSNGR